MNLNTIGAIILNEASLPEELSEALDAFVRLCSQVTNIRPDPCFNAWAGDALLDNGVAINPEAAAHCASDYHRSVVFIRGVYAAITKLRSRFPDTPLEILYAGCGPFATLLLPLLGKFSAGEIRLYLLDFHQRSLDNVTLLLSYFGLDTHEIRTIRDDACNYQHRGKLHLVITETMQKSLEQEPQFAVTANLAPQLSPNGVFIPQRIDVALSLADLDYEKYLFGQSRHNQDNHIGERARRYSLATVCSLMPERAFDQMQIAQVRNDNEIYKLDSSTVVIPELADFSRLDAALFTRICVFEQYWLNDYESQITLPHRCHELSPLAAGERYLVSYHLGNYPKFEFERLPEKATWQG